MEPPATRLDLLKTLGDNTRYAIYLELARSPRPLSTAEVAESLGLHPNTVRPHLERMRDVGLLEVRPSSSGGPGRPVHLYSLSAEAPSLGLEPPVFPMLSRMLLDLAADAGLPSEPAVEAGRSQGRRLAHRSDATPATCVAATVDLLDQLGFDPAVVVEDGDTTVGFGHCPFAELAESQPQLVCSLHRGIVEGFVDEVGGAEAVDFHDLSHRSPCRVDLVAAAPPG
ncbi:MAG: helix-turn-helix transcriptional regulator [Microthrixaceae bacterium]